MMRIVATTTGVVPRNSLTKDHYIPRCYGGLTHVDNLVAACGQCNWIRGSLDAETFYTLVQYWFKRDSTLPHRWHTISKTEYNYYRDECYRVESVQWRRRVKKCLAATILASIVPFYYPPHSKRA